MKRLSSRRVSFLLFLTIVVLLGCTSVVCNGSLRALKEGKKSKDGDNKDDEINEEFGDPEKVEGVNVPIDEYRTIPKIFILGSQKGGSSSLFEFLMHHPLICKGTHKEPHFFDREANYISGREGYIKLFPPDAKCDQIVAASRYVDGTTMMYKLGQVIPRMAHFYSEEEKSQLRFIVLLREPVSRDYSWYQQVMRDKLASGALFTDMKTLGEEESQKENVHIHRSGRYVEQLEMFVQYFKRNQILVLNSGTVFKNSTRVMEVVSEFLGLQFIDVWKESFPHDDHLSGKKFQGILDCTISHIPQFDCHHRDEMAQYYEPWNQRLYDFMKKTKSQAFPEEPDFPSFGDEWKKIKCINDSRGSYNTLLAQDPTIHNCHKPPESEE